MKKFFLYIILSALLFASCFNDGGGSSAESPFVYPTYDEINSFLDEIHTDYPDITYIETVGTTESGREIRALIISDNPSSVESGEPQVRFTGGIHGNEKMGVELLVRMIRYLTASYGSDTAVKSLVDSRYICIIPVLNPDGLASGSRYNKNGVDLNRNFNDAYNHWAATGTSGSAAFSEAESKAFRDYSLTKNFVLSITYHTGSVLVNLPFDFGRYTDGVYPAQNELIKSYAKTYTKTGSFLTNPDLYVDPYMDEGTINGGDWYVITGSLQDWSYTVDNCLDLTIEVADSNPSSEDDVQQVFMYNRDSILAYISRAGEDTFDGLIYSE